MLKVFKTIFTTVFTTKKAIKVAAKIEFHEMTASHWWS